MTTWTVPFPVPFPFNSDVYNKYKLAFDKECTKMGITPKEGKILMYGKWAKDVTDDSEFSGKYILWCPTSPERPEVVFPDRPTAIKVAYTMAKKFRQKFFVCKIVGMAALEEVKFTDMEGK